MWHFLVYCDGCWGGNVYTFCWVVKLDFTAIVVFAMVHVFHTMACAELETVRLSISQSIG